MREERPEWRAELRRLLLREEIVWLPEGVGVAQRSREIREPRGVTSELGAAQAAACERFARVEQVIAVLRETGEAEAAQTRALRETVRQKIGQPCAHSHEMAELRAAVQHLTHDVIAFRETVEERFLRVEARLDRVEHRLDRLVEIALEWRAQQRPRSWLGCVREKIAVRPPGDWAEQLRPLVGAAVFDELLDADLLVRVRMRRDPSIERWLVVEVSGVVDRTDLERAVTRAMVLQPAPEQVVLVVPGERVTEEAMKLADRLDIVILRNGRMQNREDAAARWVGCACQGCIGRRPVVLFNGRSTDSSGSRPVMAAW